AVAGACRIDGLDLASRHQQRLAFDQRQNAAFAERDADGLALPQASRRLGKAGGCVAVAQLSSREESKLGLVQDQDIDQIQQRLVGLFRRCRIEDRGGAGGAGALEECGDRRQRDLELADRDVTLHHGRHRDITSIDEPVGAWHDHDGVVGIGNGDDRRAGMRTSGGL
ncbi:hypothetical protein chiPu_0033972, partial [Chiloscyllium punctatum]|nr:hypothetical protein [Chiloscyllium punctatum]